jgi:hypothetical protein
LPEICKSVTITVTTEATAVKTQYIDKKHLLIEPLRSNTGKIYVALSYDLFTGRRDTDFEALKPAEPHFYGSPQGKAVAYIWYYAETSGDGFNFTASDGSLERPIYPQDYHMLKFVRTKFTQTLVNNTAVSKDFVVPAGKRWLVVGGIIQNADNVPRNSHVKLMTSDPVDIAWFRKNASLGAGDKIRFPSASDLDAYSFQPEGYPVTCNAGEIVRWTWEAGGASTGGDAVNFFEYYEVDLS